jgi:hypothetical protein
MTITTRSGKISDTIEEIGNINWQLLTHTTATPQARFDTLYETIKEIQNNCQPLKTTKLKNDEAWMTPRIKDEIVKRQWLYKQDNMVARKKQSNFVRHLIRGRKHSYYRNLKDWWPVVNKTRGKTKNKEVSIPPDLLSKEFRKVWGGEEQPDLKEFMEPLTTHNIGLNIKPQMTIETLRKHDFTWER